MINIFKIQLAIKCVLTIWVLLLFASCANEGIPSGGKKDTIPPKVSFSEPLNFSTNFHGNKIKITFDEYVVLKSVNQKLIVSPLLSEKPDIKLKGKTLLIDIKEKLQDSTTYSFNFGDAIADNNEGNVLNNFAFVFSTGPTIDSLSISGTIKNAFTQKPEEGVLIMAYSNTADSVPLSEQPQYIARSLKDGSFKISNIKESTYKLFALKDANNNYIFDQFGESIAFEDTLITPYTQVTERIDTLKLDTLGNDTIIRTVDVKYFPDSIELKLFDEDDERQYLLSSSHEVNNSLLFVFNNSPRDSIRLKALNFNSEKLLYEYSRTNDSITVWISDSVIYNMDTLKLELGYEKTDSTGKYYLAKDTLNFGFREKSVTGKKPKTKTQLKLSIHPKDNAKLNLNKKLSLFTSSPIADIDTSKIQLTTAQDSIPVKLNYTIVQDSLNLRRYYFETDFKEGTKYKLIINDSAFVDIAGCYNDSTGISFATRSMNYYGKVIVNLQDIKGNCIVQLLNQKEKILAEKYLNKARTLTFDYLTPGNYKLKCIQDKNNNRKWDTGKYIKKLQPEKTDFYDKEIKVRSNWDLEIDWKPDI